MSTERANDVVAFKKFLDEQLSNGGAELTLKEALARWEAENQMLEDRQNSMQAIDESLKNAAAGRRQSLSEVLEDFRREAWSHFARPHTAEQP